MSFENCILECHFHNYLRPLATFLQFFFLSGEKNWKNNSDQKHKTAGNHLSQPQLKFDGLKYPGSPFYSLLRIFFYLSKWILISLHAFPSFAGSSMICAPKLKTQIEVQGFINSSINREK